MLLSGPSGRERSEPGLEAWGAAGCRRGRIAAGVPAAVDFFESGEHGLVELTGDRGLETDGEDAHHALLPGEERRPDVVADHRALVRLREPAELHRIAQLLRVAPALSVVERGGELDLDLAVRPAQLGLRSK